MKALIKRKPEVDKPWYRGLDLVDKPEPTIKNSDEVKIKVTAAAICGTDVSIYNGTEALKSSMSNLQTDEVIVGHEFCGQLWDIGERAKRKIIEKLYQRVFNNETVRIFLERQTPADLINNPELLNFLRENFYVSAEMHIVCGRCRQCRLGQGHVCKNTYIKGLHRDGAFTEYVVVPAENLILFAKGEIQPEIIAFMDAVGNATHTVQAAEVKNNSILILGAGIQGMMATAVAAKLGAAKIFVTDLVKSNTEADSKSALLRNLGADWFFDVARPAATEALHLKIMQETDQTGVDAVLEMSGSYGAYADGFRNIRMGGTMALLGLPSGSFSVDFSKEVIFRGINLKGVIGRRIFSTWETMTDLLLNQGLDQVILDNKIISHDLPLEKFEEGFEALRNGQALKVIFRP